MNAYTAQDAPGWEQQQQLEERRLAETMSETRKRVNQMMKGKASNSGGDFQNPTPGNVGAVCTRVIDLGTQSSQYGEKRKVLISWEIDEQMSDGRPFLVSSSYTLSYHAKASLRQMLEGWRGKAYGEGEEIDIAAIIGRPCLLNLVESVGGNGSTYVNVKSVGPLPKGMTPVQPAATVLFDLDGSPPDWDAFNDLSQRLQEKIAASPEYQRIMASPPGATKAAPAPRENVAHGQPAHSAPATAETAPSDDFDDDIPF